MNDAEKAAFIREQIPANGLFAGLEWRISPTPFPLGENLAKEIESLGRVLLQFYRAVNLLYRKSAEGKQPEWVARWLDLGKPRELIELQRSQAFKNDVPRVMRPDILLTETGFSITELDSVPGGIGLTAWLGKTYSAVGQASRLSQTTEKHEGGRRDASPTLIGGGVLEREHAVHRRRRVRHGCRNRHQHGQNWRARADGTGGIDQLQMAGHRQRANQNLK